MSARFPRRWGEVNYQDTGFMDMKFELLSGAMALGLALVAGGASAAVITETITFNASAFGGGAPFDPVSGSFTLTFDPLNASGVSSDIVVNALNLPGFAAAGATQFGYFGSGNLQIYVGNFATGPDFILFLGESNSAILTGNGSGDLGRNNFAFYRVTQSDPALISTTGTFSVTSGVPEPATWAVMLMGFGAVGLSLRGRQRIQFAA